MQRWMSLFSRKNWMVSHNLEIVLAFLARDRIPSSELFLNKFRVGYVGEEHRRVADASLRSRQEQLCYIKTFIQDLRVCECIENIDKIFVLRSFPPSSRRSLISLVVFRRSERMVPDDPSFRTNRRVSRSSRDQRDTRPRVTHVTLTRGVFLLFRTLIRRESALTYNRRLIFIKIFFSFNKHALSGASRYKGLSEKFIPFLRKHSFPSLLFPHSFVSLFFLLSIIVCSLTYLRISGTRVR